MHVHMSVAYLVLLLHTVSLTPCIFRRMISYLHFVLIPLQSERDTFYYYAGQCTPEDGVFAVRHKQYKAHFFTKG